MFIDSEFMWFRFLNIKINFRNILLRCITEICFKSVVTDIRLVPKTLLSTDCTIKTNTTCEECLINVSVRYNHLLFIVVIRLLNPRPQ